MKRSPSFSQFTKPQIIILLLVGILGVFWIILAGAFVISSSFGQPTLEPVETNNPQENIILPTATLPSITVSVTQPVPVPPTLCAQSNNGVHIAEDALILDDGSIEVTADGAVLLISLAGIKLSDDALLSDQLVQYARDLVSGRSIMLVKDKSEQDERGRLVRYVFANGQFVNYELVRQGLATAVLTAPDQACASLLRLAEQQAKGDQLGLWNPVPIPTATFMPFVTLDPTQAGCDCSRRYVCSDFATRASAQVCYNACNDYHSRLDPDRDGIACEGLP
jgi:hypothetical protein